MTTNPGEEEPGQGQSQGFALTLRKGLLWQQKDGGLFSRWKERYFILTKDYLSCFKKASSLSFVGSDMGSFLYKVNLVEVDNISFRTLTDKKRKGGQKEVISINLLTSGDFIELWSNSKTALNEWMFSLKEAANKSKGRREALIKKSQTLCIPSQAPSHPFALSYWATTRDDKKKKKKGLERASSADLNAEISFVKSYNSLKATTNYRATPVLNRKRISVLSKDIDLSQRLEKEETEEEKKVIREPLMGPRLAPQCKGIASLVSLDRRLMTRTVSSQPCPRSLQVSPALAQRSLYAQHILSSPEIISSSPFFYTTARRAKDDIIRTNRGPAPVLKSATSEFSFIRPDSPLTLPYNKSKSFYGRPSTGEQLHKRAPVERTIDSGSSTLTSTRTSSATSTTISRPSSYHYDGEKELDDMVSQMKINDRRKKRMNKILEKTSQQFCK